MKEAPKLVSSLLLILAAGCSFEQLPTATVLSVGDGDGLRVSRQGQQKPITIRLACIDAPEMRQASWGQQAANFLKQILPKGQRVSIREIETDKYGRTVAEIYKGNQLINLLMVRQGQAVVYQQYLNNCAATQNQYLQAEAVAKQERLGFWNQPSPCMPWDYRHGKCVASPSRSAPVSTPSISPSIPTSSNPIPKRAPIQGSCDCPYDLKSNGNQCGGSSAYSREGGKEPTCYVGETRARELGN